MLKVCANANTDDILTISAEDITSAALRAVRRWWDDEFGSVGTYMKFSRRITFRRATNASNRGLILVTLSDFFTVDATREMTRFHEAITRTALHVSVTIPVTLWWGAKDDIYSSATFDGMTLRVMLRDGNTPGSRCVLIDKIESANAVEAIKFLEREGLFTFEQLQAALETFKAGGEVA